MRRAAKGQNVRFVDAPVDRQAVDELMGSCDCYVSLHRSEGFGLTMAEAMAFGKPVIATNYGGNTDFMTRENSYLVDYELATMERKTGPYEKGWVRADANVAQAASYMRRVFEDREEARRVGEKARSDVERLLAPRAVGEMMLARLKAIEDARAGTSRVSDGRDGSGP
jgi:glycosyltransferase involved in cell wall biosynthesis